MSNCASGLLSTARIISSTVPKWGNLSAKGGDVVLLP